jgi:hypothetical protein
MPEQPPIIRNYFNIFCAGGGIIIFQKPVELNQHHPKKQWKKAIYRCLFNIIVTK